MTRRLTLTLLSLLAPVVACSAGADDAEAPPDPASEDEVRGAVYDPPSVECINTAAASGGKAGEVAKIAITNDHGTFYVEVEDWALLEGFDTPLLRNRAEVVTATKAKGMSSTFANGTFSLADSTKGVLTGTLQYGELRAQLACRPLQIFCQSKGDAAPKFGRVDVHVLREVQDFQLRDVGAEVDIVGELSPKGIDATGEVTFGIRDSKGTVDERGAKLASADVGALSIGWNPRTRSRTGRLTFSKVFASKYELGSLEKRGADLACELTQPRRTP